VSRRFVKCNLLAAIAVLIVVAACTSHEPKAPTTARTAAPITIPPGRYSIVPEQSVIVIRVYRAGALSALGHNHVLTSGALSGTLEVARRIGESHAHVAFDVASLAVDTSESRAAAGPDFSSVPTKDDIAGTQRNLMGPKVLDADAHPQIAAEAQLKSLEGDYATLDLTVHVAGHDATIPVQAVLRLEDGALRVESQFEITHTALGMTPFTALGGALKVADAIKVAVVLEARIGTPTQAPRPIF